MPYQDDQDCIKRNKLGTYCIKYLGCIKYLDSWENTRMIKFNISTICIRYVSKRYLTAVPDKCVAYLTAPHNQQWLLVDRRQLRPPPVASPPRRKQGICIIIKRTLTRPSTSHHCVSDPNRNLSTVNINFRSIFIMDKFSKGVLCCSYKVAIPGSPMPCFQSETNPKVFEIRNKYKTNSKVFVNSFLTKRKFIFCCISVCSILVLLHRKWNVQLHSCIFLE